MADQPPQPPDLEVSIPMPSGLKVTAEQPYHILVVSSLAGSEGGSVSGPLQSGVAEVTADTFEEVMAAACPSLSFTATDPLASGNVMVEVNLRFDSMRAFDPKQLVQQIPATKTLADVREQIVGRMHGKVTSSGLSNAVSRAASADPALSWLTEAIKWTPSKPGAAPDVVDSLLGQIDTGEEKDDKETGPPPKTPIGALVSAAASDGTSIPSEEASALRRTLGEIDRRLSSWLTMVLHSPQVQALEGAWRSLAFLVSQINFRKGARLSLLHHPWGEPLERFRTLLIDPVLDEGADAPDLIVVDSQFGNTASDFEALDEFAQHGASLPAVVLAGVGPSFFGVKHGWQIPTLPSIINLFDQWQFAKWKALRGEAYARSLGVVFGRCLLRPPYDRKGAGDLEFGYREEAISEKDFLWASGAIAGAVTVARSVADTGWPTAMAGYVHGRIEGFPIAYGGKKGEKKFGPTDTELPQQKIEELGVAGINAVVGIRDHDDALVWNGLSAARPQKMDPSALLQVSLPYQLFAARMSILLFALKPHLSGTSPEKMKGVVATHVRDWLKIEGQPEAEQMSVQTRPAEKDPSAIELAVTVTPPQTILPAGIPVVLGYRVKK
jgi:type VI secretion system protein ImpC